MSSVLVLGRSEERGKKDDQEALKALDYAIGNGVNFFDTADVYGDGHSEELLAKVTKGKNSEIHIATKFSRLGMYVILKHTQWKVLQSIVKTA